MNKLEIILVVAVALLYVKWALWLLLYLNLALAGIYRNHPNKCTRVFAVPNAVFERVIGGGGERYVMYHLSTIPCVRLRVLLYRGLGAHIGKNVIMYYKTKIRHPHRLHIGAGSIVGDNAELDARSELVIGNNVNISSNVSIWTLQHDHRDPLFRCPAPMQRRLDVRIEDRAWLGSNIIVLPGVTIGEGAVCCAGCVVTKDVPPYTVVAGIPAKKVGDRPRVLEYEFKGKAGLFY